jgi:hypothetical protein
MAEAAQRTFEGQAHGGSGGGKARVAASEAMGLRQFPPTPSLVVPICAGEETRGLGRQPGRLGGLSCPSTPLAPRDVFGDPDNGSGWHGCQPGRPCGLDNFPSSPNSGGS